MMVSWLCVLLVNKFVDLFVVISPTCRPVRGVWCVLLINKFIVCCYQPNLPTCVRCLVCFPSK